MSYRLCTYIGHIYGVMIPKFESYLHTLLLCSWTSYLIPVIYFLPLYLSEMILMKFTFNIYLKLCYTLSTQILSILFCGLNCVLYS